MKKYNPKSSISRVNRPKWAEGLENITLKECTKTNNSNEELCARLKLLKERNEKAKRESLSLASKVICKD